MDDFTLAYLEAALWSTNDESDESGGVPLDENYGIDDFAPATRDWMIRDAKAFQNQNWSSIEADQSPEIAKHGRWELAGHDFWLTRNRHGAGFEDGHWPTFGKQLALAARRFGEVDLYVGDDGLIYSPGHEESANGMRAVRYPKPPRGPRGPFVSPRERGKIDVDIVPGGGGRGYQIRRFGTGEFWNGDHWLGWPPSGWDATWETEAEAKRAARSSGFNVIDTRLPRRANESPRANAPRGIYKDMPYIQNKDYVLHYREGKVPRWNVDRVGAGGTHTTIGPTRGYSDIDAVRKAIEDDAHVHAVSNATIHDASGEELGKLAYGRLHWFPGALAMYSRQSHGGLTESPWRRPPPSPTKKRSKKR